ncbi:hypothetical protein QBC35DRAFT_469366 [Podospora australis]|uniref:Uncharacterized protein n=1 Tax=Podospora australis TaxID=1536484 RepID=A0AAN6X519_9PEZI|nr:hypothetical protein QBC35DRAFT_469366 [Podospora australis]
MTDWTPIFIMVAFIPTGFITAALYSLFLDCRRRRHGAPSQNEARSGSTTTNPAAGVDDQENVLATSPSPEPVNLEQPQARWSLWQKLANLMESKLDEEALPDTYRRLQSPAEQPIYLSPIVRSTANPSEASFDNDFVRPETNPSEVSFNNGFVRRSATNPSSLSLNHGGFVPYPMVRSTTNPSEVSLNNNNAFVRHTPSCSSLASSQPNKPNRYASFCSVSSDESESKTNMITMVGKKPVQVRSRVPGRARVPGGGFSPTSSSSLDDGRQQDLFLLPSGLRPFRLSSSSSPLSGRSLTAQYAPSPSPSAPATPTDTFVSASPPASAAALQSIPERNNSDGHFSSIQPGSRKIFP